MNKCPYIKDKECDIAKCEEFHIRADERRKIDEYMRNVAHIDISEYLYYYEKEQT